MAQVKAAIVLSQATVSPPGGYSSGGRDDLIVSQEITATNLDNGSVTSHEWELFVPVGQTTGGYSLAGAGAASLTCTPPTYGDCTLKLTVRGDPLPDGSPNIATAEVVLGIRCRSAALLAVYPDGVPIPHQREGTADRGTVVVNAAMGREGRVAEAIFALILLALAGGGAGTPAILAANEAALTAADSSGVANGTRAYVASHRSVWRKQTSDGVGLTAHERIVGYTDGHVWQREFVRSAYYELQPEWWIDPNAGSDEATGADDTHPIKTLKELFRRVAPDGVWHVSRAITVHVGNNYVGNTLPDITFHTGTGAVTVSFVGWEANPTVHTQYTVDSTVAPVPSTNQRDTATMTAAVSDWTVGDIVRDESNNGGDAYFCVGFIDGGVPERVELCQGVESVIGDVVIDPEAADTFRRVELAPLTIGGIRVIGGVPISIALCNVDSAGAPTSAIEGVKFIACKLANVWIGPGSSASGCSLGSNCRAMGSRDSADAEYASLYRCFIGGLLRVTTHVDLYECYIRSAVYLERYASAAVGGPCQVHLSAVHGAVFSLTDYGHTLDLSTQYSLYGGAPHVVAVASQVVGGVIRMLSDGTSVAFASTESDMQYTGTGDAWESFYPRPDGAVAANYPGPADIINFSDWVAAPFGGQLARNRYCDLMIAPVEPAS